jgi:hypothetical protein
MKTYGTRRGQISHQIPRIACYGSGDQEKRTGADGIQMNVLNLRMLLRVVAVKEVKSHESDEKRKQEIERMQRVAVSASVWFIRCRQQRLR